MFKFIYYILKEIINKTSGEVKDFLRIKLKIFAASYKESSIH